MNIDKLLDILKHIPSPQEYKYFSNLNKCNPTDFIKAPYIT